MKRLVARSTQTFIAAEWAVNETMTNQLSLIADLLRMTPAGTSVTVSIPDGTTTTYTVEGD